jgi:hypothetical protein
MFIKLNNAIFPSQTVSIFIKDIFTNNCGRDMDNFFIEQLSNSVLERTTKISNPLQIPVMSSYEALNRGSLE